MDKINELIKRIIDIDFFGASDMDATPETVKNDLLNNPLFIVETLVDELERVYNL